jgi:ATP/maltotriose-dependent transcriptional regulator MalT
MHLIITSRQPFPLPVPRLRMRRQVLEIVLG